MPIRPLYSWLESIYRWDSLLILQRTFSTMFMIKKIPQLTRELEGEILDIWNEIKMWSECYHCGWSDVFIIVLYQTALYRQCVAYQCLPKGSIETGVEWTLLSLATLSITTAIWRWPFGQWQCSFQMKAALPLANKRPAIASYRCQSTGHWRLSLWQLLVSPGRTKLTSFRFLS